MSTLLSVLAVAISALAIQMNQWVSFLPQLGIEFQYRKRRNRMAVAGVALGLALLAYWLNPSRNQLIVIGLVMALMPLSGFMHASKALVAVNSPTHVSAAAARWASDEAVLGYVDDNGNASAWQLSTLIPHHLINDTVGGQPILVAW